VTEVRTVHTADLDPATRGEARALLYDVFDDMTEDDWEHALGGFHALARDSSGLIGHASLIQRRLLHRGRALRAGYVEAVAVRADRRGEGHGAAVMAALEDTACRAYEVAALGAAPAAAGFYAARGWQRWRGPTSALTPDGIRRTPGDDGCVFVLPLSASLDLSGELTCDWRNGEVW
jgi:aminoglycoside 2'-N-acetyltransferase I